MGGRPGTLERFMRLTGLTEAPASERPYRCRGCRTGFDVQYHVCPECGSFSVESAGEIAP
jgi:hypothetical protein